MGSQPVPRSCADDGCSGATQIMSAWPQTWDKFDICTNQCSEIGAMYCGGFQTEEMEQYGHAGGIICCCFY